MSNEENIEEIEPAIIGQETITDFYTKNKKNIQIGGIALLAIALAGAYYFLSYKPGLNKDALDSIFVAERYLQQDSLNKALNGDGTNPGFLDVASEFGGTKTGDRAAYSAGLIYLKQGKFNEAIDYFSDVDFSDEIMAARVIMLEGDCYSELGEYDKAADFYMDAADKRSNVFTTPAALKKAAIAYEAAGEFSDALEAWKRLYQDYNSSEESEFAEAYIAKMQAKIDSK